MTSSLKRQGWDSYFERILTSTECGRESKTSVLLRLMSKESPQYLWCLGDERQDLEAARAIGARAILVRAPHNSSLECFADVVVDDFTDVRLQASAGH